MTAVDVRGLRKSFHGREVLRGFDLNITVGTVFALLGRNGAGKSTTLRLLLGLLTADGGEIRLSGQQMPRDRHSILANVGSMIESPSLYENLTARENLAIDARVRGLEARAVSEALEIVELADDTQPVREFSLGMKQRLSLALAVVGRPSILILDEPTNGLDPMGIADMRRLLRDLPARLNTTVLLSTHILAEAAQVATDLAILEAGELCYSGSLEALRRRQRRRLRLVSSDAAKLESQLLAWNLEVRNFCVPVDDETSAAHLIRRLVEHGVPLHHAALEEPSLEEIYFEMIGIAA
ncbi:MAG: ABC transporter ATP-binding protein [Gammaproteobacteria bacterium]